MPPRHLPALDGLRACAVLLVLWCHVPLHTEGYPTWLLAARALVEPGALGVEIFFVLSGFLITRILRAERQDQRPVRWFLLRRVLRIFPAYYLLLAILWWTWPGDYFGLCAVYLANVLTIGWPEQQFPMQHAWSLAIEEHFYLLWPLLVAFAAPQRPQQVLLLALPLMLGAAFVVGHQCEHGLAMRLVGQASPIRFFSLAAGCLVACAEDWFRARPSRWWLVALLLLVPALLANNLLLVVFAPQWTGRPPLVGVAWLPGLWLLALTSTALVALLTTLAFGARRTPWAVLASAPLRAIGRISYGLYLYHLPIFYTVLHPQPTLERLLLALAATFAAAGASYWLVERPILRFGATLR
ncbi:MAG: acyltransferase [Planctomycetes bacterium]|nr:acyltransferase [Planctomycetota bacterium]